MCVSVYEIEVENKMAHNSTIQAGLFTLGRKISRNNKKIESDLWPPCPYS